MPHVIKYEQRKWSEDYIATPKSNTRLALQEGEVTGLTTCQGCYRRWVIRAYIHLHMSHLVAPFHGCIWLFDILDTASLNRVRIVNHWVTKHWTARISSITPHPHQHHHQQHWYGPREWKMVRLYYVPFPHNHLQMSNFQSLQKKNSPIAIWHQ